MKVKSLKRLQEEQGKPLLPTKKQEHDPTKQGVNRKRALVDLNKRYNKTKRELIESAKNLIRSTPREVIANVQYDYQVDLSQLTDFNQLIQRLLNSTIMSNQTDPTMTGYWLSSYVESAYQSGAAEAIAGAQAVASPAAVGTQTAGAVRALTLSELVTNPQYQRRVNLVAGRSFELMQGLVDSTRSDLADTLARGMAQGQGLTQISRAIADRIEVSRGRAQRIARTEINNAYRTASRDETRAINNDVFADSEYEMQMLWFSALSPTTRPNHASRHGSTYTTAEVEQFYSTGANAINCLCSQTPVLVHKETGEVFQQATVDKMKKDRADWKEEEEGK